MHANTDSHFLIWVYDDGPPPDNPATAVSLCPSGRGSCATLASEPSQVTCRHCRTLMGQLGIE